ncbi:dihydrolipoamide acetyltransferase family protein [Myceligenerans cantabricum]
MTRTFALPDLGEGLTEAEIVTWLVAEGDVVVVDQAVAEVETAKSLVEVPTPYAGVVERLCASEGETLEVGLPLLEVGDKAAVAADAPDTTGSEPVRHAADEAAGDAPVATAEDLADTPVPTSAAATLREEERAGSGNVLVGYGTQGGAPEAAGPRRHRRPRDPGRLARGPRRAERRGPADLHGPADGAREPSVPGTAGEAPRPGVAGSDDAAPRRDGEVRIPLTGFQKAAATAMARSRAEIPEATIWVDVDFTALTGLRAARPDGPGLLAYLARFVTAALAEHPVLNARFDAERDEIVQLDRVNLGLAVQGARGLVAPAVLGAERMTTGRLDAAIRDLVTRTREGGATSEELTAGTFTLNNYGGLGVDGSAPIINHPQVAMLGVGRIIDRPWVVDGEVVPRKIAQVSFVFDHRVCDGVVAAGFLRAVTGAVESPISVIERL